MTLSLRPSVDLFICRQGHGPLYVFEAALLCWTASFPVAGMCPVGLTLNLQVPLR